MIDWLGNKPWLRKLLAQVLPENWLIDLFQRFRPKHAMVVLMDFEGNYLSSLHDPTGAVIPDVSQVADADGRVLFLGSYHSNFIGKLVL